MANHIILGLQVKNRKKDAANVQKILGDYGCVIKTRIGLHDVSGQICSETGVIVLELHGDSKNINQLQSKLGKMKGVVLKKMAFG